MYIYTYISSVQLLSCVRLFATPRITACKSSLSITNSHSLPKLMCIESVIPSSHRILCRPILLLPPIPPSIRVFSKHYYKKKKKKTKKLVEVMEFQLNYFKSKKMMLLKCCTQYTIKFEKLSSGHRTEKGQF